MTMKTGDDKSFDTFRTKQEILRTKHKNPRANLTIGGGFLEADREVL